MWQMEYFNNLRLHTLGEEYKLIHVCVCVFACVHVYAMHNVWIGKIEGLP